MTSAKIIADSISEAGIRITTLELELERYLLAQLNTHRMFSRSAQSSRAVPVQKMIDAIQDSEEFPVFQKNKAGMQSNEILDYEELVLANDTWNFAKADAIEYAETLSLLGVHKQWAGRLLEPFSSVKVVVTATEWGNFFKLRLHHAAQPEMQELAQAMRDAMDGSRPEILSANEWHLPYITDDDRHQHGTDGGLFEEWQKELPKISAARCAVFPTFVGVFLAKSPVPALGSSLPHVRGGVSVC